MKVYRRVSHSVYDLKVHIVWVTKYRYHVLKGDVQLRCREILRQVCDAQDIYILKGVISQDHVHMHLSYPAKLSISDIVKRLKGRSSRVLMSEFPVLKKCYWGSHLWGIGYGAWSTGTLTNEMVSSYLEHHGSRPNGDENFILD